MGQNTNGILLQPVGIKISKELENKVLYSLLKYLKPPFSLTEEGALIKPMFNVLHVDGIKHISKAKDFQIINELKMFWISAPLVTATILNVWRNDYSEVFKKIQAAIFQNDETAELENLDEAARDQMISELININALNKLDVDNSITRLLVAIAIFIKSNDEIPGKNEEQSEMEINNDNETIINRPGISSSDEKTIPEYSDKWASLLDMIKNNFPDDFLMVELDNIFFPKIKDIAADKLERCSINKAVHAIEEPLADVKKFLEVNQGYFEYENYRMWQVHQIDRQHIEEAGQILSDLRGFFVLWETAQSKKSKQNTIIIKECDEKISQIYKRLDEIFNTDKVFESLDTVDLIETHEQQTDNLAELPIRADEIDQVIVLPNEEANDDRSMTPTSDLVDEKEEDETYQGKVDQAEEPDPMGSEDNPENLGSSLSENEKDVEKPLPEFVEQLEEEKFPGDGINEEIKASLEKREPSSDPSTNSVTEAEANQAILENIIEGDLSRAYWIALAQEQNNWNSVIPSWLLAGVQGSQWLMASWPAIQSGLLNDIREEVQPRERDVATELSIMGFSLALGPGLFENGAGWEEFFSVDIPDDFPELGRLVEEVDNFVNGGHKLEPIIVQNILGKEQVEARIRDLASRAQTWLDQAAQRGTSFPEVWKKITGQHGTMRVWFEKVAQDDRKSVSIVLDSLKIWSDRNWLDGQIQKFHNETRIKLKPIDGTQRNQLISWLLKAMDIASEWCDTIIEANSPVHKKQWELEHVALFCSNLKKCLPGAISDSKNLQAATTNSSERAGYLILEKSLRLMAKNLAVEDYGQVEESDQKRYQDDKSLKDNLVKTLIFFPGLNLNEDGHFEKKLEENDLALLVKRKFTAEQAFELWLDRHNYAFLDQLLMFLPHSAQEGVLTRKNERFAEDIERLEIEIDRTTERNEQALVDELASDQDHNTNNIKIESIKKQIKGNNFGSSSLMSSNLQLKFDELANIRNVYERDYENRLEKHRQHWDDLQRKISTIIENEEHLISVETLISQEFQKKDLRAVTEHMAYLDAVVTGKEFDPDLFLKKINTNKLIEFNQETKNIDKMLELAQHPIIVGKKFSSNLPGPRQRDVSSALDSWQKLKKPESKNLREPNFPHVVSLMNYLGWEVNDAANPVSLVSGSPTNFQHWRLIGILRGSPVPQFGSDRMKETSGRTGFYEVVGAWERPGADSIDALMKHIGRKPCILFYFGRMIPTERNNLVKLIKKKQYPLIIVDEILMVFLAQERDKRHQTMFDCTLPYSHINPYAPGATGSVPPEMYFGRESELIKLEDQYGPSIVYGGRQLGKSALLRQLQRQFHNPERGQYAIYEDIRLIGDIVSDKDYKTEITEVLINVLSNGNIIEKQKQSIDIGKLSDLLINQIKSKGWRVILLIDEADNFLEADAGKNFPIVTALKRVMDQTDRMFKVVFAGLHNVQRFTKTSNQPLAHLGEAGAIQIGPLEPKAAIALIESPLRALGYVFGKPEQEDMSLIAHILSYTNYHPGLLQLFGQYLVDHLNSKSYGMTSPPYSITRSDIEAVYRISKVRETIEDRFNITLTLDERYKAIVLSLILEQWDEKNGFNRSFTPKELLDISRFYWPAGFGEDVTIFKGFLDEMCGLGVLSSISFEQGNIKYRLRSPNLVSLMGTQEQIFNRMVVISKSQPLTHQRKLESYHAPIAPYYSPLTYAQERVILGNQSGVCLVFGTQATGVNNLPEALQKTAKTNSTWAEIKIHARTETAILDQLKGFLKQSGKSFVAYRDLDGTPDEMADQVIATARFCRQIRDKKLRVVFCLTSDSAWKWFQLVEPKRYMVEQDYVEAIITLNRWDKLGIRQLLDQHNPEIPAGEVNIKKIFDVTGGWPNLMDKFIDACQGVTDPLPALDRLNKELMTNEERKKFISSIGLNVQVHHQYIDTIIREQELISSFNGESIDSNLELLFGKEKLAQAKTTMEYLNRLSVLQTVPHIHIEPVVAKLWYEPES